VELDERQERHNDNLTAPISHDIISDGPKRNGIRFPRHAVKVLRDWLEIHRSDPYPNEEQRVQLELETQLTPLQITNWLANARRRRKIAEKSKTKRSRSPHVQTTTGAIAIPIAVDKPWDELNPLERWRNSPPENDPAAIADIVMAVTHSDLPSEVSEEQDSRRGRRVQDSSSDSNPSRFHAPSTVSHETSSALTSSLSASSAAFSHGSSRSKSTHGSFGSFGSSLIGKKGRQRKRRLPPMPKTSDTQKRIFQCTFCTDTFRTKYDWTRHEKSLHLSLEKWICVPEGPVVTNVLTGEPRCAYCDAANPTAAHLETHNHKQCDEKGLDSRTFYRKDHLRQHLRLMHGCELRPAMQAWRSTADQINSRCGFCSQRFATWSDRTDHLVAHFKAGAMMVDWKGCRGFDPNVAAQVSNAMPPYLIGVEAVSPNPFSASRSNTTPLMVDRSVPDGENAVVTEKSPATRTTCWEKLTINLGRYAKQMAAKGEIATDEMLQAQARKIIYDSDDTWNQTAADNPEWLDLFKKALGWDVSSR
jgi:hypothetical protein